ncbi:uncharacterized protein A4U43_C04F17180 [Asparagus officinalis]|uniref:U-box domain-containing protein n=1 Tax=Asparagus officinalis TaxID=4686 RepID=A0A5P1F673_ASPOF|nr:uncharacterized protein A4U43_C04F17180 [Asparagus officinalis]
MENPVTVSTGVTYERENIKKWLFTYKKTTCPATMQPLTTFDLTPNTTLKNLILSWHHHQSLLSPPSSPISSVDQYENLARRATNFITDHVASYNRGRRFLHVSSVRGGGRRASPPSNYQIRIRQWIAGTDPGRYVIKLELLSDEISSRLSSSSIDVLIEIVSTKRNRHKAIEAGAVCVLIELLPDANRHKCEKIMLLIRKLCECPEGRLAFAEHGLGVAAVSKKILRVSDLGTKLGVKILWRSFTPKERVIEDMMVFGSVGKLIGLLHIDGRSSTKEKAVKMLKMHGGVWRQYDCFPREFREYLKLLHCSR